MLYLFFSLCNLSFELNFDMLKLHDRMTGCEMPAFSEPVQKKKTKRANQPIVGRIESVVTVSPEQFNFSRFWKISVIRKTGF
jgi:hypothetical protein